MQIFIRRFILKILQQLCSRSNWLDCIFLLRRFIDLLNKVQNFNILFTWNLTWLINLVLFLNWFNIYLNLVTILWLINKIRRKFSHFLLLKFINPLITPLIRIFITIHSILSKFSNTGIKIFSLVSLTKNIYFLTHWTFWTFIFNFYIMNILLIAFCLFFILRKMYFLTWYYTAHFYTLNIWIKMSFGVQLW